MTSSDNKKGGPGWGLGECLWSPSAFKKGSDGYATMRSVQAGDLILHLADSVFAGRSVAAGPFEKLTTEPPQPGKWAGRPLYYRVLLKDYQPFTRPLSLNVFLTHNQAHILAELKDGVLKQYPFVKQGSSLITRQGGYLSRCTSRLYRLIRAALIPQPDNTSVGDDPTSTRRYWVLAPGEGGRLWNEFQEKGIAAVGWDELGDLRAYASRSAIQAALYAGRKGPNPPVPVMDSKACIEFRDRIEIGDCVIANAGRKKILGVGLVTSDYRYDPTRHEYHHIRDLDWISSVLPVPPLDTLLHAKALTNVTDNGELVGVAEEQLAAAAKMTAKAAPAYTIADAIAEGLFLPSAEVEDIVSALRRKMNVVLQGPPGVGKTFAARMLAYALIKAKEPKRVELVQFHQSYSYEDFVQGWRPSAGGFQLRSGVFHQFCDRARTDLKNDYVFIVDEINRGNLSKIFGELMMLIEPDKRGAAHAISLTYSETADERFSVPKNVYLIGLMNTADRSLTMVDYALRRRFVFFDLAPQFHSPAFQPYLTGRGISTTLAARIVAKLTALNAQIAADKKNLGPGYVVGHSYFIPADPGVNGEAWYRGVVEQEVGPLLHEYWFDNPDRAKKLIAELLAP